MKKFLMIAALAVAPAVLADAPSYQYLEASIQKGSIDLDYPPGPFSASTDADGFSYRGSFAINEQVYAQIDKLDLGTNSDGQIGAAGIDQLSIGWHNDMFFARLGYEWAYGPEYFIPAAGSSYLLDMGLRTMVSETFEVSAHYGMSDSGPDFGKSMVYGVGAAFMFDEKMGVTFNSDLRKISDYAETNIGPEMSLDVKNYGFGFRYNFN